MMVLSQEGVTSTHALKVNHSTAICFTLSFACAAQRTFKRGLYLEEVKLLLQNRQRVSFATKAFLLAMFNGLQLCLASPNGRFEAFNKAADSLTLVLQMQSLNSYLSSIGVLGV